MLDLSSERSTVSLAALSSAAFALPLFLVGALAVQIRADFVFDAASLGLMIGIGRGAGVITSVPLGSLADRLGATRALGVAAFISVVASIGVAVAAWSWLSLAAWLVLASTANSLGLPGANRLLIRSVRSERRGLAFGIKQSAPPTATLLAGLSVPAVALTIGWRWTFVLVALLASALVLLFRMRARSLGQTDRSQLGRNESPEQSRVTRRSTLAILAVGIGLTMMASTSLAAFLVDYAVNQGSPEDLAGYGLAAASLATVCMRLWAGARADRMASLHLRFCSVLIAVGALGFTVLAASNSSILIFLGALIALPAGWGSNGVFWYALTRANPASPGLVTGVVRPGALLGGSLGPFVIGLVITNSSYHMAWALAAGICVMASVAMLVGDSRMTKEAAIQGAVHPA
jgi:predicted MFS family arabinose efflux permease